jgi:ribonuclease-3
MDLDEIQKCLSVEFKDPDLLLEALTHISCLNEPKMGLKKNNESLAWLGDALIYWVVTENEYREGLSPEELHDRRLKHINKTYLAECAIYYGLDEAMRITEGQAKEGGRANPTNLYTVYEAIVGAIYRDKDYECAKYFVQKSCN